MATTDEGQRATDYGRLFPWTHLFRAFRIAIDVRKLLLASLALGMLAAGDSLFSLLPFAPDSGASSRAAQLPLGQGPLPGGPLSLTAAFIENPWTSIAGVSSNWSIVLKPITTITEPAQTLFQTDSTWPEIAFAWTRLLWALVVWAIFGGAITRIAAVQFARDEQVGLRSALKFALGKFLSYLSAPLLPAAGIGVFWALCLLLGIVGRVPLFGDILVGALWGIPLLLGLLMSLVLIGVAVGWPLMYVAISAEGSDAFDGFSRTYSYVYSRPWHYLWFTVVASAYGSVVIVFIISFAGLSVFLASRSVASGIGADAAANLFQAAPVLFENVSPADEDFESSITLGTQFVGVWLHIVSLFVAGFVYSYFWSASTIIYFLLRQSDDATDLDEVFLPEEQEPDELLPLVGVAASDQPVIERPAPGDVTTDADAEIYDGDTEMDIRADDVPERPQIPPTETSD